MSAVSLTPVLPPLPESAEVQELRRRVAALEAERDQYARELRQLNDRVSSMPKPRSASRRGAPRSK